MLTSIINRVIYQPGMTVADVQFTPAALSFRFEDIQLIAADGVKITGWYILAPNPRGAVLYLHGNAGNRRDWAQVAPEFIDRGYNLFILDYRGYGESEGKPSEKGLYLDGEAAWNWLTARAQLDRIPAYVLGKSLGSGVASYLAARQAPAGLILDSAFTAMHDLIAIHARWLPRVLTPKLYDTLSRIGTITCPTLVIHGERDDLVPLLHGLTLYRSLRAPKALAIIPGAGHNDIDAFDEYHRWVFSFLSRPLHFVQTAQDISESALASHWQTRKHGSV
ncbi:MAG: alpha/beta hydrolase [Anaerolinea sp.]|nr:alpha/beta hydrolase [Anaerolinea sp.]